MRKKNKKLNSITSLIISLGLNKEGVCIDDGTVYLVWCLSMRGRVKSIQILHL